MSQRAELVALLRAGAAPVTELCRQFGVSRKTAYKWLRRFEQDGEHGLNDASRAPHHRPRTTPEEVQEALVDLRVRHPLWGARKLAARLQKLRPDLPVPAPSTCHDILARHGLVRPRPRRPQGWKKRTELRQATAPNEVWSVDFKGQFRLGNRAYCFPLTIQDVHSRCLLRCDALESVHGGPVRVRFERAFRAYGLPDVIRSDNGSPFASRSGALGWSRLSVWWIRLGIEHERIEPGKPQQNGRHERMHRTLKKHTARPPSRSFNAQQRAFDRFRREYNEVRPHEALGMEPPREHYARSARVFPRHLPEIRYPAHYEVRRTSTKGDITWRSKRFFLSEALRAEPIGFEPLDDGLWRLHFGSQSLGLYSERHPEFGIIYPGSKAHLKLLPMCPDDL